MTSRELIKKLRNCPPNAEVTFASAALVFGMEGPPAIPKMRRPSARFAVAAVGVTRADVVDDDNGNVMVVLTD